MAGTAAGLGLAVLIEVHDRSELDRALAAEAEIVGVNSRNLRTLTVDPEVLEELGALIPAGVIAVAESGIRTPADIERLSAVGYSAFLVGERLDCRARSRRRTEGAASVALKALSMMTRVKICGIRRMEDAMLAAELGADALGLRVLAIEPALSRPEDARAIVAALPPFVTTVGVFVNQSEAYVSDVARLLNLGAIQLHGEEAPESYGSLSGRVIKSVTVREGHDCRRHCRPYRTA